MKHLLFFIIVCTFLTACKKEDSNLVQPSATDLLSAGNASSSSSRSLQTIQVNGSIDEQTIQATVTANGITALLSDTWSGDLTGSGHVKIFSANVIDLNIPIYNNVIGRRLLFTSNGNLFMDEVGQRNVDVVTVTASITGGTGMYKNATGQLTLNGLHTSTGVQFTYSGSITLVD